MRGGGQQRENSDRLEKFARHFGQTPEGVEQQLDDPERENPEPREAQQSRSGLLVDEL